LPEGSQPPVSQGVTCLAVWASAGGCAGHGKRREGWAAYEGPRDV